MGVRCSGVKWLTDNLSRYAIAVQFCNHWGPSSKRHLVYI